jgi:hypothetical protein
MFLIMNSVVRKTLTKGQPATLISGQRHAEAEFLPSRVARVTFQCFGRQ